jgi:hypothetical protein
VTTIGAVQFQYYRNSTLLSKRWRRMNTKDPMFSLSLPFSFSPLLIPTFAARRPYAGKVTSILSFNSFHTVFRDITMEVYVRRSQGRCFSTQEIKTIKTLLTSTDLTLQEIANRMKCAKSSIVSINHNYGIRDYRGRRSNWVVSAPENKSITLKEETVAKTDSAGPPESEWTLTSR